MIPRHPATCGLASTDDQGKDKKRSRGEPESVISAQGLQQLELHVDSGKESDLQDKSMFLEDRGLAPLKAFEKPI